MLIKINYRKTGDRPSHLWRGPERHRSDKEEQTQRSSRATVTVPVPRVSVSTKKVERGQKEEERAQKGEEERKEE